MSKKRTIAAFALAGVIATASVFGNTFSAEAAQAIGNSELHAGNAGEHALKHVGGKRQFGGVAGIVTSINGDVLTVEGKDGVSYTVDIKSSLFRKGASKESAIRADIKSGDTVRVHGVRTGTTVTAKTVVTGSFSGKAFSRTNKEDK